MESTAKDSSLKILSFGETFIGNRVVDGEADFHRITNKIADQFFGTPNSVHWK